MAYRRCIFGSLICPIFQVRELRQGWQAICKNRLPLAFLPRGTLRSMINQTRLQEAARERQCIHRKPDIGGEYHTGESYIAALQRLHIEKAQSMARKVGAFFWSDAPSMKVWLCQECATELGLHK